MGRFLSDHFYNQFINDFRMCSFAFFLRTVNPGVLVYLALDTRATPASAASAAPDASAASSPPPPPPLPPPSRRNTSDDGIVVRVDVDVHKSRMDCSDMLG